MGDFIIPISPIDRATPKNRTYFKLEEMLPKDNRSLVEAEFVIKRYPWMYRSGFVDIAHNRRYGGGLRPSEWFEIEVINIMRADEFEVRVGIVRKSGKEIVVSNAEVISLHKCATIIRLIRGSELHKIMHTYKELEFFGVIDEKDDEKKKFCK